MRLRKHERATRPVHPNAGIEAEYRAKLQRLVDEMARSYHHWVRAQYRETPPTMAMDSVVIKQEIIEVPAGSIVWGENDERWIESLSRTETRTVYLALDGTPAKELQRELSLLGKRWQKKMDEGAPKLAEWFARSNSRRSTAGLKKILADAGMSVEFKPTPAMRDAYQATISENVGLIRSIASEYHTDVEGAVMRSVTAGRDLAGLTKELEHRWGVTSRRAKTIALNQNNQATATFVKVRQVDLGLKAIWLHSHAGKVPRPTHLANNGETYDPAVGWFDPDPKVRKRIWPGQLINCRCVSRSVVKGFS